MRASANLTRSSVKSPSVNAPPASFSSVFAWRAVIQRGCRYMWMHRCSSLGLLCASSHGLASCHAFIFYLKLNLAEAKSTKWIYFNTALIRIIRRKKIWFSLKSETLRFVWLVTCQSVRWVCFVLAQLRSVASLMACLKLKLQLLWSVWPPHSNIIKMWSSVPDVPLLKS